MKLTEYKIGDTIRFRFNLIDEIREFNIVGVSSSEFYDIILTCINTNGISGSIRIAIIEDTNYCTDYIEIFSNSIEYNTLYYTRLIDENDELNYKRDVDGHFMVGAYIIFED